MFQIRAVPKDLLLKLVLAVALVLGGLMGVLNGLNIAAAQDMAPAHYVIQAGAGGPANIDLLQFAPENLKVHRGDTVSWSINGFHTVDFATEWPDLVVMADVNGQQTPSVNPAIAFPNVDNGSTYTGGQVNSGLFLDPSVPPVFTLVMDVEPGTYTYLCDVHPGMIAYVEVVGNEESIPNPSDVSLQAAGEFGQAIGAAMAQAGQLETQEATMTDNGAEIMVGNPGINRATINLYHPFSAHIQAGQSVTWTIPKDSIEPHTISWPPTRNQDVVPVPQDAGPPILQMGPTLAPMTQSGAEIASGDAFSSGLLNPGQSFTLTFTEAGTYNFTCNIHPGMNGVVFVS